MWMPVATPIAAVACARLRVALHVLCLGDSAGGICVIIMKAHVTRLLKGFTRPSVH